MTYQQWVQQANMDQFKTSIINSLTALKFNNPDLNAALLDKVLEMINNRYQDRTLWPTPVKFQGMLANDLINSLPVFVNNLKKYSFWAQYTDPTKFGKQVTDNGRSTEQGTSESTDRETSSNERTNTVNKTDNVTISDTLTSQGTVRDTTENTKTTNNTNTSSSTDSDITIDGAIPQTNSSWDTLDTTIAGYDKNVAKKTNSSNTTDNGTETNNDTYSSTTNSTDTTKRTDQRTITDNATENVSGTNNTTSNTTDNTTRTHENTVNELDWQKAIAELSNEDVWHLHSERLVSQLEYLFVGVSYYEF